MDQSLFDGLEQLKNIGRTELVFETSGLKVTLGSLRSEDDILISRKMEELQSEGLEYVQTYKIWMIAFSVVRLNELDLSAKVISCKDDKGGIKPVVKEDHLFKIISCWSRSVLNVCFRKYGELLVQADNEAEKGVVFEVVDIDAEIKRLQEWIDELKEQKESPPEEETSSDEVFSEEIEEAKGRSKEPEPEPESDEPESSNEKSQ